MAGLLTWTAQLVTMGNRNVEAVIWAMPPINDVPPMTWRCLVTMAKVAHDDTQLYYGGVEWLELAMGYQLGPSGRRAVMRHLELLERAGYVRRTGKKRGSRWIYELHLPGILA
jgi:DNA-binding transcriptional ArsR family regulator